MGRYSGRAEPCGDCARQASDGRQHRDPRPPSCGGRKRGTPKEALGRSRGGFSTKIHLRVNGAGLPMRTVITPGQDSDYAGYDLVMADNLPQPAVLVADRGYDSNEIREDIESRNALPMIPMRKNRKVRKAVDMTIYTLRNIVERCFNRLKNSRRLATRYDKTADSFLGFIDIACIRLWIRHLST
ncbi:IS5 family transposase [Paracoccus sp. DMF]|nr:IS5 family transposase [Paracoccus sp. DMF]